MFHIQATGQQTLVFTLMLIKVNYFVVLGHWYKTCILFSLCYVQKFKISRCIQHTLMTYLCLLCDSKHFSRLCLNYFCFSMPNALMIPVGFFFSLISFYLYDVRTFFFCLNPLLDYNLLTEEVNPIRSYITNENSHLKL